MVSKLSLNSETDSEPEFTAATLRDLTSDDAERRRNATFRLVTFPWRYGNSLIAPLLAALHDTNPDTRADAAKALGFHAIRRHIRVVPGLIRSLRDPVPRVRAAAARSLASQKPTALSAVPALLDCLQDRDSDVAIAAATTLTTLTETLEPVAMALVPRILSSDSSTRHAAYQVLNLCDTAAVSAIVELAQSLLAPNASIRCIAIEAIGNVNLNSPLLTRIVAAFLRDPDPSVRKEAAASLALCRADQHIAVTALLASLADPCPSVRAACITALGPHANSSPKWPDICDAYADGTALVPTAIAGTIKEAIELQSLVPAFAHALDDQDVEVRTTAARILSNMPHKGKRAVLALEHALNDDDAHVRLSAATALAHDHPAAFRVLTRLLNDDDSSIRFQAVWAMGACGPDAIPALESCLAKKDRETFNSAFFSLLHIVDRDAAARYAEQYLHFLFQSESSDSGLKDAKKLLPLPHNPLIREIWRPFLNGILDPMPNLRMIYIENIINSRWFEDVERKSVAWIQRQSAKHCVGRIQDASGSDLQAELRSTFALGVATNPWFGVTRVMDIFPAIERRVRNNTYEHLKRYNGPRQFGRDRRLVVQTAPDSPLLRHWPDPKCDHPQSRLIDAELRELVESSLTQDASNLIMLRFYDACSWEELATVFNVPISTLHSRYTKALDVLRRRFAALLYDRS